MEEGRIDALEKKVLELEQYINHSSHVFAYPEMYRKPVNLKCSNCGIDVKNAKNKRCS